MTLAKSSQNAASPVKTPITIRPADATEASTIADLGALVFSDTFAHTVEPHELQSFLDEFYTHEAIAKDFSDPNKDIIVATNPDTGIVGFAYLTRESTEPCLAGVRDVAELQRIYVHPSAHGCGIGGLLGRRIEEMAREQGFKNLWLGVWKENYKALNAYGSWGYKRVGEHDFVVGTVAQRDYIMLKYLD